MKQAFSTTAAQCLAICIIGYVANFFVPRAPIALVANVFCIWRLFDTGRTYHKDSVEGFDAIVAAEAIVGFGVMSLVFGLVSLVAQVITGQFAIDSSASIVENLRDAVPFAEGLATAGLAPFFAILFRLQCVEDSSVIDPADDLTALAHAAGSLTKALRDTNKAMDDMRTGAAAAGSSATGLADVMRSEVDRWTLALQEGGAAIKTLGISAADSSGKVGAVANEAARLKSAMADASTLMEELARLIGEIERFVAPSAKVA